MSAFPNSAVDAALFDRIMRSVRVDGPLTAPVCFLTMEDGGGFKPEDMESKEQFASWFELVQAWVPAPGELAETLEKKPLSKCIGQLGVKLSKVMARLAGASDHRRYVREMLYQHNEQNIKYYPISFATADGGSPEIRKGIEGYIGMKLSDYRDACHMLRPGFFRTHPELKLTADRFYVVCCTPWFEVLKPLFDEMSYKDTYTYRDGDKEVFKLYFDTVGKARFGYIGLLARPIPDAHLARFAEMVGQYAEPEIIKRIKRVGAGSSSA